MNRVRIGIIGAGEILNHVSWIFHADELIEPVAVADINEPQAKRCASELDVSRVFDDYREVLRCPDVDAVYIATPPYLHRPMVLDAVVAGKHAICEKPFMLNTAEVRAVHKATRSRPDLKVGCCSSRFHDQVAVRTARQMIASGELGDVYRLGFNAVSAAPAPGAQLPEWSHDRAKSGGGIAFDWGPYDLDWISHVLSDQAVPREVFATMGNYFAVTKERTGAPPNLDGRVAVEIHCNDGLSIHWERRAGEHGPVRELVEIRGTEAGLDLFMTPHKPPAALVRHTYIGSAELESTPLANMSDEWSEALVFPIRDFAASVIDDREPASPIERQLFIHGVLDAAYASVRTSRSAVVQLS